MQELQFLEFMGGSNLNAHSNYLICIRFIQINTVQLHGLQKQVGCFNHSGYPGCRETEGTVVMGALLWYIEE